MSSVINGSDDGDIGPLIPILYDLSRLSQLYRLHRSEREVNSNPSDDQSELQSSMESTLTEEIIGEEMENEVQQPIKNEDIVLQLEPTVPNPESENPTYRAATPPAPPPPSPSSLISTPSRDLGKASSDEFVSSFVVMGCTRCYIYVMVSDCDPKCPKCGSYDLLDEFRGNFSQCKRREN